MIWIACVGADKTTTKYLEYRRLFIAHSHTAGRQYWTDENGRMVPHQRVANDVDLREELPVWQNADGTDTLVVWPGSDYSCIRRTNEPQGAIDRQPAAKTQLVRWSLRIASEGSSTPYRLNDVSRFDEIIRHQSIGLAVPLPENHQTLLWRSVTTAGRNIRLSVYNSSKPARFTRIFFIC